MGWGGRLFETGYLLTFSTFRMGAYSRRDTNSRLGAYSNKYGFHVNGTWILDSILKWDLEFIGLNSQDS